MTGGRLALAALAAASCTSRGEVLRPGAPAAAVGEVRLAAGWTHACAVVGAALSCWGADDDGRLGVAASGSASGQGPVTVSGNWSVPAAGAGHSCAIATDGAVACWGANDHGQLGAGDFTGGPPARAVPLPARAVDLRSGFDHTCALLADGTLWCWGANLEGQLGQADQYPGADSPVPLQVGAARDWTFVATGQGDSCGIRAPGALFCWGRNTEAQLGQGQGNDQRDEIRAPIQVGADSDWVEVSCGPAITCARKRGGSLYCWGDVPSGALGVGDATARTSPTQVPGGSDWQQVATNAFHTCGLRAAGALWCAGRGTEGEIGAAGFPDTQVEMRRADPADGWAEVRTGRFFTCARALDGAIYCMGINAEHELAADPAVARSQVMLRAR